MGPTWGRQDPGGPHVGHTNLAILGKISGYPTTAQCNKSYLYSYLFGSILYLKGWYIAILLIKKNNRNQTHANNIFISMCYIMYVIIVKWRKMIDTVYQTDNLFSQIWSMSMTILKANILYQCIIIMILLFYLGCYCIENHWQHAAEHALLHQCWFNIA